MRQQWPVSGESQKEIVGRTFTKENILRSFYIVLKKGERQEVNGPFKYLHPASSPRLLPSLFFLEIVHVGQKDL